MLNQLGQQLISGLVYSSQNFNCNELPHCSFQDILAVVLGCASRLARELPLTFSLSVAVVICVDVVFVGVCDMCTGDRLCAIVVLV